MRTPLSLRWAWRDLRGSARHFRLVFLCLFLSLAAITAVQITGDSVMNSIHTNARVILGGDWVLRQIHTPVGQAERDWLAARGADLLDTTEMRVMLIEPQSGDSALIELKAVAHGYPLYGEATTDPVSENFHDPLERGLVLDTALRERLGLALGDTVKLGEASFPVAAWVAHEPDRAGASRFGLAPRVFASMTQLERTGLVQPGSMAEHHLRVRFPEGTELKPLEKEFKDSFPDATWRLTDTERAAPQVQRFVNNLVQFMTLIGLSALLIGGIGIANGMRAYLQTRLGTIAILKSVGASTKLIRRVYLWQIAGIGLTGTLAGIAAGSLAPLVALPAIQNILPFPVALQFTAQSLAVPFCFGLLTTGIFALWPLGSAERTSALILFRQQQAFFEKAPPRGVLAAIAALVALLSAAVLGSVNDRVFAAFFIVGAALCFVVFWSLGKMIARAAQKASHFAALPNRLALRHLGHAGNATAQTLVSLGIGLTVLIAIAGIEKNLRATLQDNLPDDAPAFFFLDIQPHQKDDFARTVLAVPTAQNLILTPNLRGRLVAVNGVPAAEALKDKRESWLLQNDRGFTYTATQPAHSTITAGEWWPPDYDGPPLVSVVDDVQRGFGVKPGDTLEVEILGRRIAATIANVRDVSWTNFTINFAMTFAPGALDKAPHSWLATVVAEPSRENDIQRAVTREFPNISMIRLSDAIQTVSDLLGQMNQAVRVMALLALVTGLIVLTEALVATRAQRAYETLVLKVVGAPRKLLTRALLAEFALLGAIAAATGSVFGTTISWAILDLWMDQPWAFYPGVAFGTAAASLAAIVGTGWFSLRRTLGAPVLRVLHNE